ncbi:MAG TPA: ABC transporter substrate-binding protein [Pseudonocardiaceae bacterium]|nr:ABC transporter substrate-binding protein [Pseudonocardiaceae bacterium]
MRRRYLLLPVVLLAGLTAACTGAPTPSASGRPDNSAMVLAEAMEPASLNPLGGYAPYGASKIFDGLLEYQSDGSLRPVLATGLPTPAPDGKSWTITIRNNVKFSDGSPLTAADVVATYQALLNPAFASPLRGQYPMLTDVTQTDASTVRFGLAYPYAPFPNKLVLGIVPAASVNNPTPIGTGPYVLQSWAKGQDLVLTDNPKYSLGAPPKVKRVTVEFVADDATRAQRLRAGKLDGAALSPTQAAQFAKSDAFTVLTDPSADLRAITLPESNPVAADPTVRLALNQAVDRTSMVTKALGGQGAPAMTPIPSVLPEFVEPTATFTYDATKATAQLYAAGWVAGTDGIRSRNGVTAELTLDYPSGDTTDAALAQQFADNAKVIGVKIDLAAVEPAQLVAKEGTDAVLISTGNPFDPDLTTYDLLDSAAGNAFGYRDAMVDTALQTGRTQLDPGQRAVAYRAFQRAYVANPALVCLVQVGHTYVLRANWTGYVLVTDAAGQGINWGPLWNLDTWTPR